MAVIFSTTFTEGNWSAWDATDSARAGPFDGFGCGSGPSNTCNQGTGGAEGALVKTLAVAGPPPDNWGLHDVAVRLQFGMLSTAPFAPQAIVSLLDGATAFTVGFTTGFFAYLFILDDGTMRLQFNIGPGSFSSDIDTSAGVFPLDGSIHGIQFIVSSITPTECDYKLVLDNVQLLTGSFSPDNANCSTSWGYIPTGNFGCDGFVAQAGIVTTQLFHYRVPECGEVVTMTNCAEFIVDTNPAVVSYPACSAPSLESDTCVAVITGMSLGSDGRITITGVNFPAGMVIDLRGPGNVEITYDVVSQTSTVMVIENLNPPVVSGQLYCVSGPCV